MTTNKEHVCPCCNTTLGTAWNDRYCNMCEYWQGGRTTQAATWDMSNWSFDNRVAYLHFLSSNKIPHQVTGWVDLLYVRINN